MAASTTRGRYALHAAYALTISPFTHGVYTVWSVFQHMVSLYHTEVTSYSNTIGYWLKRLFDMRLRATRCVASVSESRPVTAS